MYDNVSSKKMKDEDRFAGEAERAKSSARRTTPWAFSKGMKEEKCRRI